MRIEVADAIADVPAAWDAVVGGSGAPVFYQRAYLEAYEKDPLHPIDARRYLVGYDDSGTPRLAVPAFFQRSADRLGVLGERFAGFGDDPSALLTHVWHCYDTWVPAAGFGGELVEAVAGRLRDLARELDAAWYGFVNVGAGSALARRLEAAGMGPGAEIHERFVREIAGYTDFTQVLAELRSHPRRNLRGCERRAAEAGATITTVGPDEADLDGLLALARRNAAKFGNSGFYPEGAFQRFVRRLGPAVRVIEIRIGDRLIASGACLVDETRFHNWTCGIDYSATGAFSPYYVLYCAAFREAIRSGARVLEGGRANGEFKRRYGLAGRRLCAYVAPTR